MQTRSKIKISETQYKEILENNTKIPILPKLVLENNGNLLSHSHTHPKDWGESTENIKKEITLSKALIEKTYGTEVDLAPGNSSEKTAALPSASSRPTSGRYPHAYILLSNGFKMKGTYQLADGTTYYSKESTDAYGTFGAADKTISASAEHTDLVDNMYFGEEENGWDGVMSATPMPGSGTVSAL